MDLKNKEFYFYKRSNGDTRIGFQFNLDSKHIDIWYDLDEEELDSFLKENSQSFRINPHDIRTLTRENKNL